MPSMPPTSDRPALRAMKRAAARHHNTYTMLPIPPNDPVVSYVPLRRLNYSAVEHRETLLPPDLSLAWQIHRLWAKKKRQMAASAACVLRDPVARLEAELVRRCMRLHRCDRQAELQVLGEQLAAICALPSRDFALRLSIEHWHVLPQSWYVWNERGEVQCPCLLAREPIRKAAGLLRTSGSSGGGDLRHDLLRHGRLWMQPSAAFDMLMLERPLVERVEQQLDGAALHACYRPARRAPLPYNVSCFPFK